MSDKANPGLEGFTLRAATPDDSATIVQFIRELASFEKLEDKVIATPETIRKTIFEDRKAQVLIGECDGEAVAFAVMYTPFSTFLGTTYLFLEDLYVKEAYRGRGYGSAIFNRMAQIAVEQGATRLDWVCLDWNHKAIDFYKGLGAVPLDDWTLFRLQDDALKKVAGLPG